MNKIYTPAYKEAQVCVLLPCSIQNINIAVEQLELVVTAAVEINLCLSDCFHIVDIGVKYTLMNVQSQGQDS